MIKDGVLVEEFSKNRFRIYWSSSELEHLKELFPEHSNREIAELLGKTVNMVQKKARQLGLRKTDEYMRNVRANTARDNFIGRKHPLYGKNIREYYKTETPEQKRSRIAKTVASKKSNMTLEIARRKATRAKWTDEQREHCKQKCREVRMRAIANGAVEKAKATYAAKSPEEKRLIGIKASISRKITRERKMNEKNPV